MPLLVSAVSVKFDSVLDPNSMLVVLVPQCGVSDSLSVRPVVMMWLNGWRGTNFITVISF